ncbi:MAG: DUF3089 domain-containing protein [Bacteroidaceae bacterium]|nr:DUF3089 domain-containing protein [Bacteroidaceae bacterium]
MKRLKLLATLACLLGLLAQCQSPQSGREALPQAPNYDDASQWYISDRQSQADVFYIISTETGDYTLDGVPYYHADTYNDSLRAPLYSEMLGVDTLVSGRLNYYAPYYRQCSLQSFGSDSLMAARYPIALDDVRRAFKHYLSHYNQGRPFILAGFSQGAMIMLQLLQEMDEAAFQRLIAAYAIGVSISKDQLASPHIIPATGAADTGVTICYNSVRDARNAISRIGDNNVVAINPVNWRTDATPVTFMTEPSPLLPVDQQQKDTLTVHLDQASHLLFVEGYTATDYLLPLFGMEGNYHTREIWLYRDQLRENMALRASTFLNR